MWERIYEILKKEIRQALRDPKLRATMFFPPVMQILLFGFAVSLDVNNVKLGWLDMDQTEQSRSLLHGFQGTSYFTLTGVARSEKEAQALLDSGTADAVVRVPYNFGADVSKMKQTEVQVLVDGSNSNTAAIVGNYATGVFAPAGTPKPVIDKLAAGIARAVELPDVQAKLTELGSDPYILTPAAFAQVIRRDQDIWQKLIRERNIKVEF
jgi:ABC-2 type transport system permease protein